MRRSSRSRTIAVEARSRKALDIRVFGAVGGFGDGQGAFGQRSGGGQITEIAQDRGEVVQGGADVGVLGPVSGFGDGQGAFGQRAGGGRITEILQDPG